MEPRPDERIAFAWKVCTNGESRVRLLVTLGQPSTFVRREDVLVMNYNAHLLSRHSILIRTL
jgi:hypothetical protein